uniref:Retrotransposon gag domain-containing protein n=1 Tax=Oryzias melastigma TaxID=30732 RepID=A0A3B3E1H7_ORYME
GLVGSFLDEYRGPVVPSDRWLASFEGYLLALGHMDLADARKCALLRHCLGQEGQRIFATLTLSDDKYASATAALKSHFCSGRSRRMCRFEFRQRFQQPGETVAHFVSALRELAKLCDFGTLEDGLIVDQLIEKTSSHQLRERLLLESDSMTLADALVIGKQLESALSEARRFASAADLPVTSSPSAQTVTQSAEVPDDLPVQRVDRGGDPLLQHITAPKYHTPIHHYPVRIPKSTAVQILLC